MSKYDTKNGLTARRGCLAHNMKIEFSVLLGERTNKFVIVLCEKNMDEKETESTKSFRF